ncbi:EF-hand domain-containing protein [Dyella sp. 2RAB6]|uniref:EF-hand domain-containing protein n=1 Tax=Dyella sp. 2RAB6 TaxID=3232992 RepID=UPI003F937D69
MRTALVAALLALPWLAAAQGYPGTPAEYLKLMDANGDGRISEQEYVDYLSAGFRRMDTNGDGVLEPEELPGGHGKPITLRSHQDNLRRQFHKLDRNHDGYLDAKELAAPPA